MWLDSFIHLLTQNSEFACYVCSVKQNKTVTTEQFGLFVHFISMFLLFTTAAITQDRREAVFVQACQ